MSPFHVNHRTRLAQLVAELDAARADNRVADAQALELAAQVLQVHVHELDVRRPAFA
jgi:hypothetical protein